MKTAFTLILIFQLFALPLLPQQMKGTDVTPPKADKIPKELVKHGSTRIDNYYWLNERENPKVIDYLNAENAYTKAVLKPTEPLQEKLYNEIIGRIKQTDMSVPYNQRGYSYYTRYDEGKEYPIYCRKKVGEGSTEEIMLNVNELAAGHSFCQVVGLEVSLNNKLLAYGIDTVGRRKYSIYVKDLETGKTLTDHIPLSTGNIVWTTDNKTIFYSMQDEALRPYKIFKHKLGEETSKDAEVFHEADETFSCYVYKTKSDKYIIIGSRATLSNEYRFIDAEKPDDAFTVLQPREKNLEYSVDHYGNKFYIVTNLDAVNFRLMETPVEHPSKENWKEVIPHRKDVLLEGIEIFNNYFVAQERMNGLSQLRVITWKNMEAYTIPFEEQTYYTYASTNPEFDTDVFRFGYSSLTIPNSTYDYNMTTKERTLLKQEEVVGQYNPQDYKSERIYATATDGTKIPISLVYKKGLIKNGKAPLLLYGYGSYGISTEPTFSSVRLSLLDRGFVYAIAHIRGGQELGRPWYEDGKFFKKKNTFTDFIACAEELIHQKVTSPEECFAYGGSAGGLLMGAVINLRPDLFKGVVAAVPFVDVVTTMLDESIPLTTGEYDEWGNPNQKDYYEYMLSYSPYDNVEAKGYPNLLVTAGLHDSQVQYWEPAKWVAKLRDMKKGSNLLLLDTDMESGHGGASGRFKRFKRTAMQYAFFLSLLGSNS